jgi:hypothetical protein
MFTKFNEFIKITENIDNIFSLSEKKTIKFTASATQKVLNYINENDTVTKSELQDFLTSLQEEFEGKRPTWSWVRKNGHLIDRSIDESTGEIIYSLTKRGERNLKVYNKQSIVESNQLDEKVQTPGLLEIPPGQKVTDLPEDHFKMLVNKKGKQAILKGLLNLYSWNIKKNPELSGWAKKMRDMVQALKESNEIDEAKIPQIEIDKWIKANVKVKPKTKYDYLDLDRKLLQHFKMEFKEDEDDDDGYDFKFSGAGLADMASDILDKFRFGMKKKNESTVNEDKFDEYQAHLESLIDEGKKEEYAKFFKDKLKKFGAESPADLSTEEKKKFFNEIADEWK